MKINLVTFDQKEGTSISGLFLRNSFVAYFLIIFEVTEPDLRPPLSRSVFGGNNF